MWKPSSLGEVIAERRIEGRRGTRRDSIIISFGRPVRSKAPKDPWWTPFTIQGCGIDRFVPVAGVDSLQSLLLALDHATDLLSRDVRKLGVRVEWLGEPERMILAREAMSQAVEGAISSLFGRLKKAAVLLDGGAPGGKRARGRAIRALDELGASVGQWSHQALERKRRGRRTAG
jgi:hypothetical protein